MLFAFEEDSQQARIARQTHFGSEAFLLTTNATRCVFACDSSFFFSAALRLCVRFFFGQNAEKPRLLGDGYGSGAVRELGGMYGVTVTVSRELSLIQEIVLTP